MYYEKFENCMPSIPNFLFNFVLINNITRKNNLRKMRNLCFNGTVT